MEEAKAASHIASYPKVNAIMDTCDHALQALLRSTLSYYCPAHVSPCLPVAQHALLTLPTGLPALPSSGPNMSIYPHTASHLASWSCQAADLRFESWWLHREVHSSPQHMTRAQHTSWVTFRSLLGHVHPQLQQRAGDFALQQSQGKSTVNLRVQTSAELPNLLQLHTEPVQMSGGREESMPPL